MPVATCAEKARSVWAWKVVLVLLEVGGFRELIRNRQKQDYFTLEGRQWCPDNPRYHWGASH